LVKFVPVDGARLFLLLQSIRPIAVGGMRAKKRLLQCRIA
jgi:hypothetical protein